MITVGIDLAARRSGLVVLDDDKIIDSVTIDAGAEPLGFDTISKTLVEYVLDALDKQQHIDLICIEDLTHRMVKAALPLRLQGALRYVLRQTYPDVPIEMLLPSVWQSFLGYKRVQGLTTKDWSSFVVHALGYKFEGTKGKALTDLNDAALIARWGYEKYRKTDG